MYTRQDNIDADDIYTATQEYYRHNGYDSEDSPFYNTRLELGTIRVMVSWLVEEYERTHQTEVRIDLHRFAEDFIQVNLNDPTRCPSLERDYINDYYIAGTFMRNKRPHLLMKKDSPMLHLFITEGTPVTIPFSPYSDVPAAYDKD